MSLNQFNLQQVDSLHLSLVGLGTNNAIRGLRDAVAASEIQEGKENESSNPSEGNTFPPPMEATPSQNNSLYLSEMNSDEDDVDDAGSESWATMSEVDSQYTRQSRWSTSAAGIMELSMITDSEYEPSFDADSDGSDDDLEQDGDSMPHGTIPPVRIVSATSLSSTNVTGAATEQPSSVLFSVSSAVASSKPTMSAASRYPMEVATVLGNTTMDPRTITPRQLEEDTDTDGEPSIIAAEAFLSSSPDTQQTGGLLTSESRENRSRRSVGSGSSRLSNKKRRSKKHKLDTKRSSSSTLHSSLIQPPPSPPLPPHVPVEHAEEHRARLLEWRQECLREAEDQIFDARNELVSVSKSLQNLQKRHHAQIAELNDQLRTQTEEYRKSQAEAESKFQSLRREHDALVQQQQEANGDKETRSGDTTPETLDSETEVAAAAIAANRETENERKKAMEEFKLRSQEAMDRVVSDHNENLRVLQQQKTLAESKLKDALAKLEAMEFHNQTLIVEKHDLETQLATTQKQVRFAENQNSILEFRVDEYKTKWENSLQRSRLVESELVSTRCDLEVSKQLAQQNLEDLNNAVKASNLASTAQSEKHHSALRSIQEQHTLHQETTAKQLQARCQENEQLQRDKTALKNTLQALTQEQHGLQEQLKDATAQKQSIEADLSQAKDHSTQLQVQLQGLQASMVRLQDDHQQEHLKQSQAFQVQLADLQSSFATLDSQDQQHQKELKELQAKYSALQEEAASTQLQAQSKYDQQHQQAKDSEQKLLSLLKEAQSRTETLEDEKQFLESNFSALEREQASLTEKLADATKRCEAAEAGAEQIKQELQQKLKDATAQKQAIEADLSQAKDHSTQLQVQLRELQASMTRLQDGHQQEHLKQSQAFQVQLAELQSSISILEAKDQQHQIDLKELQARETQLVEKANIQQHEAIDREQQLLSELKEERAQSQKDKDTFTLELENLRNSIGTLESQDQQHQKELKELQAKYSALQEEAASTQLQAQSKYDQQHQQAEKSRQRLLSDLEDVKSKAMSLEGEKQTLESKVTVLEQEQARLEGELIDMTKRWKAAEAVSGQIRDELNAARNEQTRLLAEQEALAMTNGIKLRESAESKNLELGMMQEACKESSEAKIGELQLERDVIAKKALSLEAIRSDLQTQLGTLQEQCSVLQQSKAEVTLELDRKLKEHEDSSKTLTGRYKALESERDDLRTNIESLSKREFGLNEKLRTIVDSLDTAHILLKEKEEECLETETLFLEEKETNQARILQLEQDSAALKAKIAIAVEERNDLKKQLEGVNKHHFELEKKYQESQEKLLMFSIMQDEFKSSKEKEISELRDQRKTLEKKFDNSNQMRTNLETTLNETLESFKGAKQDLVLKAEEFQKLERDYRKAKASIENLEEQQSLWKTEKGELSIAHTRAVEEHRASAIRLEQHLVTIQQQVNDLTGERETMTNEIHNLKNDQIVLKDKLKESVNSLDKTNFQLEQNKNERNQLLNKVCVLEEKCESLRAERSDALDQKEKTKTLYSKALQDFKELTNTIRELESSKADAVATTRAATLAEQKSLLNEAEEKVIAAKVQVDCLTKERKELETESANEKASIRALHAKSLKDHETSIATLHQELEATRKQVVESREAKEKLQNLLKALEDKESTLEKKYNQTLETLMDSASKLNEAEREKEMLESKLSDLENDFESIKTVQMEVSSKMKAVIASHMEEMADNRVQIERAEAEVEALKEQIFALEREKECSNLAAMKDKESVMVLHSKEIKEYERSSLALKEQLAVSEQHVLDSERKKEELEGDFKALDRELLGLKDDFENTSRLLTETQIKLKETENNEKSLRTEFLNLQKKVDSMEVEQCNAKDEVREHLKAVEDHKLARSKAEAATRVALEQVELSKNEAKSLMKSFDQEKQASIALHSQTIDEHRISSLSLQEKLDVAEQQVESHEQARAKLEAQVMSLENELVEVKDNFEKALISLKMTTSHLQEANESESLLKTQISELQAKLDTTNTEKTDAARKMQTLLVSHSKVLEDNQLSITEARAEAGEAQTELNALREKHKRLKKTLVEEEERALNVYSKEIEKITISMQDLQEQLSAAQKHIIDSRNERNELQEQLQSLEMERTGLQSALATTTSRLSDAEQKLKIDEEEKKSLRSALSNMEEKFQIMKNENAQTTEKMNEMVELHSAILDKQKLLVDQAEAKAREAQGQMDQLHSEKEILEKSVDTLKIENDSLRSKQESTLSSITELHANIEKSERKRCDLEANLRHAEKREESLKKDVCSLREENASLNSSMELSKREHESQVDCLESSNLELSSEMERMSLEIQSLRDAHSNQSRLRETLEKMNLDLTQKLDEAAIQMTEVANAHDLALRDARDHIDELQSEQNILQEHFRIAEAAKLESEKDIERRAIVLEQLRSELCESKRENSRVIADLNKAKDTIESLKKEVDEALAQKEGYAKALNGLEKELDTTNEGMESFEAERQRLENDVKSMKDEYKKLDEEYNLSTDLVSVRDATIRSLENDLAKEQKKITSFENENQLLSQEVQNLESEMKELGSTLKDSQTNVAKERKEHDVSKKEIMDMRKECDGLVSQLSNSKRDIELRVSTEAALSDELVSLKECISRLTEERDEAAKLNSSLADDEDREILQLRRQLKEANAKMMNERDELMKANASIINEKETETTNLRRQLQEVNKKMMKERNVFMKSNSSIINEKDTEASNLRRQLEETNIKMMDSRDKLTTLNASIANKTDNETQGLRRQLEKANTKITNLEESIQTSHEDRIKELKRDLEKATRENADQVKKTRKLAKILKSTLNSMTRVSRMKMDVNLKYRDSTTGEYHQMPARAEYSGPVVDSKPHGAGMLHFECGDMYLGMFENGEINGEGTYVTGRKKKTNNRHQRKFFKGFFDRNEFSPRKLKGNHVRSKEEESTKLRLFT